MKPTDAVGDQHQAAFHRYLPCIAWRIQRGDDKGVAWIGNVHEVHARASSGNEG